VISADGSQLFQITNDPLADFAPAWAPDGRSVAYVSWRSGDKDVWLTDLSHASDEEARNLTNTPGVQEDHPAWAPDGRALAYDDASSGYQITYWLPLGAEGGSPTLGTPVAVGQGLEPAWAPGDGGALALVYQADPDRRATLALVRPGGLDAQPLPFDSAARPRSLTWTEAALPQGERVTPEAVASPAPAPAVLALLDGVELTGVGEARLSAPVAPAFQALRARVAAEAGWDFLERLDEAGTALDARALDDAPRSLHPAGRAFDTLDSRATASLVLREPAGLATYWRVLVQTYAQDGSQGEPLRERAWDLAARYQGGTARTDGGAYAWLPAGNVYYVDFTELAAAAGWTGLPAGETWRTDWAATHAWHFERRDGLTWWQAMLAVYPQAQIEAVYGPRNGEP
jgi:TolB protein